MHMLPIVGHSTPLTTNDAAPFPNRRFMPSAYPTGTVAMMASLPVVRPLHPYPTGVPSGQCLSDMIFERNDATGRRASPSCHFVWSEAGEAHHAGGVENVALEGIAETVAEFFGHFREYGELQVGIAVHVETVGGSEMRKYRGYTQG